MFDVKLFLKKLQWNNGVTEISNLYRNLWCLEDLDEILKKDESLYFVSFTPTIKRRWIKEHNNPERTKTEYVDWKSYIVADFDIRSYIYNHEDWRVITNEELMAYLPKIEEGLKSDESLKDYNAIVFSGNGFHFYWIWEPVSISADLYSKAVAAIYDRIKKIFQDVPELRPDYSGSNIAHLFRLPGTLNRKEKYWLPPAKVELLKFERTNSTLISKLVKIGLWAKEQEKNRIAEDLKKAKEYRPKRTWPSGIFGEWRTWYDIINEDINIATLVRKYTWWKLADNGKNFISKINWGFTWAYVIPEENVVVHMGTPHFSDYYRVYSPFSFIMVHYADWDVKRTFQVAKELFPTLHIVSERYLWYLPYNDIRYGSRW